MFTGEFAGARDDAPGTVCWAAANVGNCREAAQRAGLAGLEQVKGYKRQVRYPRGDTGQRKQSTS